MSEVSAIFTDFFLWFYNSLLGKSSFPVWIIKLQFSLLCGWSFNLHLNQVEQLNSGNEKKKKKKKA